MPERKWIHLCVRAPVSAEQRQRLLARCGDSDFKAAFGKRVIHDTLNGLVVFNDQDHRQLFQDCAPLTSRKAKLQVEMARLKYIAPRLRESSAGGERQQGYGAAPAEFISLAERGSEDVHLALDCLYTPPLAISRG
jgi:GTP-binding GTPase Middle Region